MTRKEMICQMDGDGDDEEVVDQSLGLTSAEVIGVANDV